MSEDCPVVYSIQSSPDAPFLELLEPRTVSWANADDSHVGTYTVYVYATGPTGPSLSVTSKFILTIELGEAPCVGATLSIMEVEDLYEFYLPSAMDPVKFSVTSSQTPSQCVAPLVFEVLDSFGDPLDDFYFEFDP